MIKGIVAAYITQNDSFWLELSLKSILPFVDKVIIIDGGSKDGTLDVIDNFNDDRIEVHSVKYRKELKYIDGKQRNEYLKILKERYKDYWCLVIDSDEILHNGDKLKEIAEKAEVLNCECLDIHMEHFIWNFGIVDATIPKHFVLRRFFKVTDNISYPFSEHPVLDGTKGEVYETDDVTLFHCGYLRGVEPIIKKYYNNLKKSTVHTPEFLHEWKNWHLMGTYKVKRYVGEYPQVLKEAFLL